MRLMNSCVWGKPRMNLATLGCRPVSGLNSGTKCGLGKKRTSNTKSASSGTPFLKPKLTVEIRIVFGWVVPSRNCSVRWSRSSWTLNFEVSRMMSDRFLMGSRRAALVID